MAGRIMLRIGQCNANNLMAIFFVVDVVLFCYPPPLQNALNHQEV